MRSSYYITTPIYYVNAAPHIGTAYTTVAADTLARFMRLDGRYVYFVTGTDEHGQKVEQAAKSQGLLPQLYVDKMSQSFRELSALFGFTNDDFIRTTEERHKKCAQALWKKLVEKGDIYKSTYAGWYSVRDEAFFQESELVDGKAPTGAEVAWVEEPSYFFKLSKWQDRLLKFYIENPNFVGPASRMNEVISFVKQGLNDLCISRSTLKWGIPVPEDSDHVMYVWIDALSNYLTALGYPNTKSKEFKEFWAASVHIIGKDILRFHAIYWPAFLMAADLNPPCRIFAHGWWTREGQKISKSLNNSIDPTEIVARYGSDQIRYFLLRETSFGRDADFSEAALENRINADLANDFGNLVQRVLSFIYTHAGAQVSVPGEKTSRDQEMYEKCKVMIENVRKAAEEQALHKMCEEIWDVIKEANRYIDQEQPWSLRKTDSQRMQTVLYVLADAIRHCAVLAQAIVPKAAEKVLDQLGILGDQRTIAALEVALSPGISLQKPEGVFPRVTK